MAPWLSQYRQEARLRRPCLEYNTSDWQTEETLRQTSTALRHCSPSDAAIGRYAMMRYVPVPNGTDAMMGATQ